MDKDLMIYFDEEGVAKAYDDTYDILIHCDSAEVRQKTIEHITSMLWIPCRERLPAKSGRYLATVEDLGSRAKVKTTLFDGDDFWENVRAWMPLPEPYKEENHETD